MSFLVTSKELFQQSSIPVFASSLENRPLVQTELHRHEFFEMLYVAHGSLENNLSSEKMVLKAGDVLVIKPYVRHVMQTLEQENPIVRAYSCSFMTQVVDSSINGLEDVLGSDSPNKYFFSPFLSLSDDDTSAVLFRIPRARRKEMERLFKAVKDASESEDPATAVRRRYRFLELLATLANHYTEDLAAQTESDAESDPVVKISTSRYHKGLRRSLNYMHTHLDRHITLREMAEMSSVSISYFSILMKQATGMSFVNYLNGLRMDRACSLLRGSSENVTDICYRVGFNDYSHFSRNFKRATGISPREYRQKNS